jgi:hypothetical protein
MGGILLSMLFFAWPSLALDPASVMRSVASGQGCSDVTLRGWQHPTRTVLEAAGITLTRVQRCDGGNFDIFTVALPSDPRTAKGGYYSALYARMAEANGWNGFVLIDRSRAVVASATVDTATHKVTVGYGNLH